MVSVLDRQTNYVHGTREGSALSVQISKRHKSITHFLVIFQKGHLSVWLP